MNQFSKNAGLWIFIGVLLLIAYNYSSVQEKSSNRISYSEFVNEVKAGHVAEVEISENQIKGEYVAGVDDSRVGGFTTFPPPQDTSLVPLLVEKSVKFDGSPKESEPWYVYVLQSLLPLIIIIGVWMLFWRQFQANGGKALSFGKSRARLMEEDGKKVILLMLPV